MGYAEGGSWEESIPAQIGTTVQPGRRFTGKVKLVLMMSESVEGLIETSIRDAGGGLSLSG